MLGNDDDDDGGLVWLCHLSGTRHKDGKERF